MSIMNQHTTGTTANDGDGRRPREAAGHWHTAQYDRKG